MLISPIKVKRDGEVAFQQTGDNDIIISKVPDDKIMRHKYSVSTGLLPPVVRYIHPSRQIVVFDRPPTQVSISYYGTNLHNISRAREQIFDIWLPWTVYVIYLNQGVISEIYLYAIDGPFENTRKKLHLLPIPNYYPDGRFCQPNEKQPYTTLADAVATAYQIVWNSNYNTDTTEVVYQHYGHYANFLMDYMHVPLNDVRRNSSSGILHAWSKMSRDQVLALDTKWMPSEIIPRVSYLPTFKYNPSPMRFGSYVNEFKQRELSPIV